MIKTQHCPNCEATEQKLHDFRQEVSDIVHHYVYACGRPDDWEKLIALIIPAPKPDPLVTATLQVFPDNPFAKEHSDRIRAALDALGFEIRKKNDG